MMNSLKTWKYLLPVTIFFVFIINLLQGAYTELLSDEAYYWMYSQNMDWGFYDHPPAVSVWIYLSSLFFSGEIGVRFFSAVSYCVIIWMVWKTIDHPRKKEFTWLFLTIILSSVLLSVYGFITTPDTALMMFYSVFLYAYHMYLSKNSLMSYLLLSISIAGMMYSKYHGFLIILFVILSNFKLLKDSKLWLTVLFSVVLYFPHLYWQWNNDFISFKFHLIERGNRVYKFENTLLHFVNIIIIFGFTFPIIYQAFFKYIKTKNQFLKSLNYIVLGFIIFFFLSSFKGHVQAQWVIAMAIPLTIITFLFLIDYEKSRKRFLILAILNFVIILMVRVHIAQPFLPIKIETEGNKKWATELKEKTQGTKKLFINSYQHAATYWYYADEKSYYLKNYTGRTNHFSLLQINKDLSEDNLFLVRKVRSTPLDIGIGVRKKDSIFAEPVKNYRDISQIEVNILNEKILLSDIDENILELELVNHFDRTIALNEFQIVIGFVSADKSNMYWLEAETNSQNLTLPSKTPVRANISFDGTQIKDPTLYVNIGIGLFNSPQVDIIRASQNHKYQIKK